MDEEGEGGVNTFGSSNGIHRTTSEKIQPLIPSSTTNATLCGIELCLPQDLFNILRMGFGFFCIVMCFLSMQNVQGSLNAEVGFVALGIMYTFLSLMSFFSVPIVDKLGERKIFFLGGLTFSIFIFVNVKVVPTILYAGAVINGCGAALFWVAQGIYLSRVTTERNRGTYSSIFVAFLAAAHVAGNGLTYLFQQMPNFSFGPLFGLFGCVSAVAAFSLFFLWPPPPSTTPKMSVLSSVGSTFKIFTNKDYLLLCPLIIAYGFNLSFIFGTFPTKIGDTNWSSLALTCFGCIHLTVSLCGGKVSKWAGGNFLAILSGVGMFLGVAITTFATTETKWLYLVAGLCLGTMEAGFLIQIFIIMGNDFADQLNQANSAFRFLSGGAIAILFFMAVLISYQTMVIIVVVGEVVGLALLIYRSHGRSPASGYKFSELPINEDEA